VEIVKVEPSSTTGQHHGSREIDASGSTSQPWWKAMLGPRLGGYWIVEAGEDLIRQLNRLSILGNKNNGNFWLLGSKKMKLDARKQYHEIR